MLVRASWRWRMPASVRRMVNHRITGASGWRRQYCHCAATSALGYSVVAISGRESTHEYLKSLGAQRILGREEFAKPVRWKKQLWAGAIDTVRGPKVLAKVLAQMNYGGCVAAW